ncbi:hypothetical protein EC960107_2374, partial [Escherichia coli 96.0107]|jgi:hypothetical protein
VNS